MPCRGRNHTTRKDVEPRRQVLRAVLIEAVAIGLIASVWQGFTYGHVFVVAAAAFVLVVAAADARLGPRRLDRVRRELECVGWIDGRGQGWGVFY